MCNIQNHLYLMKLNFQIRQQLLRYLKPVEVFDSVGIKDVELQKEKWSQNKEQVEKMSEEALEELNKIKEDVEEKLNSFEV